ncbi:NADH-quinone oxidoreductase subunit NuoN [Myceligenerans pegani]|uniref:NADH-quinone oxidoreductase subunit N n=1 Tax=Myceligenerans pegani TaxID=2776917 RepID=A0ABR9N5Q0_9MICO|nr:NADH-quinone oxidoreductase subunit NuoN [Myceligenerans sp. TRM 65318]MBE1878591.1 NADH-quinone oxidoreductase subunit NuoN [Myceligenerans sp. TRM 65318]MBE3020862.1 NADH-quinone oxidoreductase subunit NuoN [Myceligenerans sp. TRM 65318]
MVDITGFTAPEIEWAALAPLLIVLGTGVIGVLVEAFVPERARRVTQIVLTLVALTGALVAVAVLWGMLQRSLTGAPGEEAALNPEVLGGTLFLTPFALGAQGIIVILAFLGVLVVADRTSAGEDAFAPTASAVPGTHYEDLAREAGLRQTEIYPLLLFAAGGMMLFASTDDLIVMFIALEVLSLPLYVLCATARRRRLLSQEAAAKYFLLGAFASALFIFGVALIYGFGGTVLQGGDPSAVGVRLADVATASQQLIAQTGGLPEGMATLYLAGVVLVVVGLLFKVGAVPFHAWTPDVYTGAPTPITGFMAAATKAAAVVALVQVLWKAGFGMPPEVLERLQLAVVVIAVLTMAVGTVVGAVQTDVKRLLAYSSIAHAGFLVTGAVGFATLVDGGAVVSARQTAEGNVFAGEVIQGVLFYLVAYGVATIGAFAVVTLVRERSADGVVLGEATDLAAWRGLGRRAPWLTAAFALFLLSMAGIPLTAGFVAKFGVFSAAVAAGYWWLAVVGVLASVVAVAFYVRVIVVMVMTPSNADTAAAGAGAEAPGGELVGTAATPAGDADAGGEAVDASGTAGGAVGRDATPPAGAPREGAEVEAAGGGLATVTVFGEEREEAAEEAATDAVVVGSRGPAAVAIALCAVATLGLGLFPSLVLDLAEQATRYVP